MSNIVRFQAPTASAPADLTDYTRTLDLLYNPGLMMGMGLPFPIDFTNNRINKGALFNVGGVEYRATANETITGTPSKYVKLTRIASNAELAPSYVASLTGVTWNDTYNHYSDGSGELYAFDEARAVFDGAVTTPKTMWGRLAYLKLTNLTVTGDVSLGGALALTSGSITTNVARGLNGVRTTIVTIPQWNMDTTPSLVVDTGRNGTIYAVSAVINSDSGTSLDPNYPIDFASTLGGPPAGRWFERQVSSTREIVLERVTGGFFDSTDFDSLFAPRGTLLISWLVP